MSDRTSTIASIGIDETGLLCATWVFAATWGVALMQLITYCQNRSKDSVILQCMVIFLFLNETVSTILTFVGTHQQLLLSVSGTLQELSLPKPWIIACYLADVTLLGVNSFMIYRYYRLTKRWWFCVPLEVLACASLAVHSYCNTLGLLVVIRITQPYIDIGRLFDTVDATMRTSKIASAMEFTVVAATYALLVIEFTKYLRQDLLNGKKVVRQLVLATIESGIVTFALLAALVAMAWSTPYPARPPIIMLSCARTYYHTLLFNLNVRNSGGMMMQNNDPSLSHISSALRTRNTVTTAPATDIEVSTFKEEHLETGFDKQQVDKEKAAPHLGRFDRSTDSVGYNRELH